MPNGLTRKRTHGLASGNATVQVFDKQVYILAAPVVARHPFAIFSERGIVGKCLALDRIGIEIIVEVYTVDVVASDNIVDNAADEFPVFRVCRGRSIVYRRSE